MAKAAKNRLEEETMVEQAGEGGRTGKETSPGPVSGGGYGLLLRRSVAKDSQVLAISHLAKTLAMKGEMEGAKEWLGEEDLPQERGGDQVEES